MENYPQLIFNGKHPTIKRFIKYEKTKPQKLDEAYHYYYLIALTRWEKQPGYMQNFLIHLIEHDRQRFLSFLLEKTLLEDLRFALSDAELIIRLIRLNEMRYPEKKKQSDLLFCFAFLLSFKALSEHEEKKRAIHTIRKILYTLPLVTDDVFDFLNHVIYVYMQEQEKKE